MNEWIRDREIRGRMNMELKMQDPEFPGDADILLRPKAPRFEPVTAWDLVKRTFVDRMPGKRD